MEDTTNMEHIHWKPQNLPSIWENHNNYSRFICLYPFGIEPFVLYYMFEDSKLTWTRTPPASCFVTFPLVVFWCWKKVGAFSDVIILRNIRVGICLWYNLCSSICIQYIYVHRYMWEDVYHLSILSYKDFESFESETHLWNPSEI